MHRRFFSVILSTIRTAKADSHKIRRTYDDPRTMEVAGRKRLCHIANKGDRERYPVSGGDQELHSIAGGDQESHSIAGGDRDRYPVFGGDQDLEGRSRWEKATIAFAFPKQKIETTPIIKHFDPNQPPVIVVYASKWAVSAVLLQKHEGL